MKRIIKQFTIDVCVEFELNASDIAASIQPVLKPDGTLDDQALSEYLAFVTQVEMYLEDAGLEFVDFDDSQASETSMYYTLADAEAYRNNSIKHIIFLRISDHVPKLRSDQYQRIKCRWRATAAELHAKYKVKKITVNESTYYDYDSACDEIQRLAIEWQKSIKN